MYNKENPVFFIPEDGYGETMKTSVEPELSARVKRISLKTGDGAELSCRLYPADGKKAVVVICHGYTESAEKYAELIYCFLSWGFSVVAYDQRGHGHSTRVTDDDFVIHVDRFDEYVSDLELVTKTLAYPEADGLPVFLFSHSMGGGVGAMSLYEYPELFDAAVLSSPMLGIKSMGIPRWVMAVIGQTCAIFAGRKKKCFTCGTYDPGEKAENSAASSETRFLYYREKARADRLLRTGAFSYGWLTESLGVGRKIISLSGKVKIKAPVLLFQSELDGYVDSRVQDRFVSRCVSRGAVVEKVRVNGVKHEIYFSGDLSLEPYMRKIKDFYYLFLPSR